MNNKIKFILSALFVLSSATYSFAQNASATATASSTATIVTPIAIAHVTDMNFGNVTVSTLVAGTVVLAPAGTRTSTGNITLPAINGTISAASFTVTGVTGSAYSITLPTTDLTLTSGSNTMIVNAFTSTPSATGTLAAGTQTLNVGATLNVKAAQAVGIYTTAVGGFPVTVCYN
jgi:hypothetical protein